MGKFNEKFDLEDFLAQVEELVNIDSGSHDIEGVTKVGNIMREKFQALGWTARDAQLAKTQAPCVEIFNKTDEAFDVFLLCHIDTVFPHGTVAKIPYREEDGKLYGAGVYDMKTSCIMTYYILKMLQEEGKLDKLSICVGLNAEEELGSRNAREWIESVAKRSKYVICTEPARSKGEMVIERKGLARYKFEIKGKAVHAGINPWDGVSAIKILAKWILELHELNNYDIGTSLNMGLINGGIGVNTVADYAVGELDLRYELVEEYDKVVAKIEELTEWTKAQGGDVVISGGITRPVMKPTAESLSLAKEVDEIALKYGIKNVWMKTGGGSDANFSGALGIPTIDGIGPQGALSHTDHEYVVKDAIEPYSLITKDTIEAIGKRIYGEL